MRAIDCVYIERERERERARCGGRGGREQTGVSVSLYLSFVRTQHSVCVCVCVCVSHRAVFFFSSDSDDSKHDDEDDDDEDDSKLMPVNQDAARAAADLQAKQAVNTLTHTYTHTHTHTHTNKKYAHDRKKCSYKIYKSYCVCVCVRSICAYMIAECCVMCVHLHAPPTQCTADDFDTSCVCVRTCVYVYPITGFTHTSANFLAFAWRRCNPD